jgi:subtilase family serine protease
MVIALALAVAFAMMLGTFGSSFASSQSPGTPTSFTQQQAQATGYKDVGALPQNDTVQFVAYIPVRNQQLLQSYVEQVSNPESALFGHYMSVAQIENTFTNTVQFNNVLSTLSSDGFGIQLTAMNSIIVGSGTVAQIHKYLGLNVDEFSNGTSSYYSSYGNPLIGGVSIYASNFTQSLVSHPSTLVTQSVMNQERQMAQQINQTYSIEAYPISTLQSVYNETGLMKKGYEGQGGSIGILDFYGNPYIKGELQHYDQLFNLPAPPSFNIVPIGPYDPNLGIATGWDVEISLDVESSHTMSPLSNITLYIANGNLPLVAPIATIDQQDAVNSLSQSFSETESGLGNYPTDVVVYNFLLTDIFYEMGALEGITFSASTGDAGGSGYSSGPLGTPGYPSTSPFVTALGGTETYLVFSNGNVVSSNQTAWSNYGFVPYNVNYGGGTGGVSMFEPLPWYQEPLAKKIPASFPNGRLVPDISLNAAIFPGVYIVYGQNITTISGGTSEASPLFAGMVAFSESVTHHSLGLVNPALYQFGLSDVLSGKIFYPIGFGYTIPWTESSGYNFVTGLGSLNVGAFDYYYNMTLSQKISSLNISVYETAHEYNVTPFPEFPDGQNMTIYAIVTDNGTPVTAGNFSATVLTLEKSQDVKLVYNSSLKQWIGTYRINNGTQGLGFVDVSGESGNITGSAFSEVFFGYYGYSISIFSQYPFALQYGMPFLGYVSWLNGTNVNTTIGITLYSYSITTNSYSVENVTGAAVSDGGFATLLSGNYATGVTLISASNAYLYIPFFNGALLQGSLVLGPVVSEPGAVAPGQDIFVEGVVIPPLNIGIQSTFTDTEVGSNLTFSLVSPTGTTVSTVFATPGAIAQLPVPYGISSGLYTIFINSSYNSYTLESMNVQSYLNGSFFGQIWVSPDASVPQISITPTVVDEGQTINISASITQNGKPIEYGMYTASIYPADLSVEYYDITLLNYMDLTSIPLYYNLSTGTWQGTAVIPSGYSAGSIGFENGLTDWAGPYDAYVTGESWNGILTTTSPTAQTAFYVNSPQLQSMQSQISSLTNDTALLQSRLSSLNQSLNSQVTALNSEIASLNRNLNNDNSTLISDRNEINSLRTVAYYGEILGLVALILAIVGIVVAATRKPKT